ncbi:putative ribonuclease H-like domain-containing protein [Tanacetum coccineum]
MLVPLRVNLGVLNDESKLWHRRFGHINFKILNKLVKGNLVRGLPSKIFENDHICVACQKGKQHKATWIENQLNHRVKIIRSDNGTEFKNQDLNQFCNSKGIKREYSNARTPQQNGVAERKNMTLIEAARTIPPIISFMRPFGCPVTILNTLDHLGKFDGKADEGRRKPASKKEIVPDQKYILLPLLYTSSYSPSTSEEDVSLLNDDDAGKKVEQEPANVEDHTLKDVVNNMLNQEKMATKHSDDARSQFEEECDAQLFKGMRTRTSSTNSFNTVRTPLNTASALRTSYPAGTSSEPQLMPIDGSFSIDINDYPDDPLMPELEDTAEIHSTGIFGSAYDDSPNTPIDDQSVGAEADFNNMEPSINVSPIPTTRIHSIHPKDQIIGDPKSAVQTRRMAKKMEPKKVNQALDDVSWVEAMQEELLQFKLLNVWTLVDLPKGKKAIGTKWVFRNKKDQRGIVVRNKARLVAQGHRQEEGIDYDEVFARSIKPPKQIIQNFSIIHTSLYTSILRTH